MDKHNRYSFMLRHLHLIGGLAFVAALILGIVMEDMQRGPTKMEVMFFHKSIGLAVLGLVAFRLLEWVRKPQPNALANHSKWERQLSSLTKVILYIVMIALPVSGVLMSWFKGYPVPFFGLVELTPIMEKSKDIGEIFESIHKALIPATFLFLGLHIAGALKHGFIDQDATLSRIAPFVKD